VGEGEGFRKYKRVGRQVQRKIKYRSKMTGKCRSGKRNKKKPKNGRV